MHWEEDQSLTALAATEETPDSTDCSTLMAAGQTDKRTSKPYDTPQVTGIAAQILDWGMNQW